MSIHFVKLIELVSIDQVQDKKFLHIVVYTDKTFEMFWEVDLETATNLQRICQFDGDHKYRLSLRTIEDSKHSIITSQITKTYLNKSTRTDFYTTEQYRQQVEMIRKYGGADAIKPLPFLITPEEFIELKELAVESLENNKEEPILPGQPVTSDYPQSLEEISLSTEEILALTGSYDEADKTSEKQPTEVVEDALSKADTSEVQPLDLTDTRSAEDQVEQTQTQPLKEATPPAKWIALATLLAIAVIGIYFFFDAVKPDTTTTSENYTYATYEIEDPFIFKLPANHVALTFDRGPSIYTQGIMDILAEYDIGATFFVLGSNLNTFPLTVERMYNEGYAIGHATTNYSLLTDMPYEKIEAEWLYTAQKIEAITDKPVKLFRPPYGLFNKNALAVAEAYDFNLVTWSLNPLEANTVNIDSYLDSNELSGAIISLVESQETIDALPTILDMLTESKLKIVQLQ